MVRLNIKALSANKLWRGRRYKTKDYERYERDLLLLLPELDEITDRIEIRVGLSNRRADLDNVAKGFIDILQKRYGFDDNRLRRIVLEKEIVKRGEEYIEFCFV